MRRSAWIVGVVGMTAVACIIPDAQIAVQPPRTNKGAVRIVHPVGLTEEAVAACQEVPILGEADSQRKNCPLPPYSLQPGLIRSERGQNFCVCQDGFIDDNALGTIEIHVEDPDIDRDGEPLDDIYGAFLLDVDLPAAGGALSEEELRTAVAYENYLNPTEPARRVELGPGSYDEPIERPRTNLKSWLLGIDLVDLCNDNDGSPLDPEQRLHSLRLVVTDRQWYVPVAVDKEGEPLMDGDLLVRQEKDPLIGVPDLPGGASYDVANYTFECLTEDVDAETSVCNCVDPMEEQ